MDAPARRPLGWPDFYGMIATTICWLLFVGALSLAWLQDFSPAVVVKIFLSCLSGPFAFFEHRANLPPLDAALIGAFVCLAPIGLHLLFRHTATAIFAAFGISLWFLIGLGLTFISV